MRGKPITLLVRLITLLMVIILPFTSGVSTAGCDVSEFDIDGLKVILKKVDSEVTAVSLFFKGGVRNIDPSNQGIEPLLFGTAKRGSENYPMDLLHSELARMGTSIFVIPKMDFTIVSLRCLSRYFDESWDIFTDVLLHPALDEKGVELARQELIARVRRQKDLPDSHVRMVAWDLFYRDHPYALKPQGTESSLLSISTADLKEYHKNQVILSRLLLVVVGKVDQSDIEDKVVSSFGKLPRGEYRPKLLPEVKGNRMPGLKVVDRDIPTNYICGVYSAPGLKEKEYYPMQIAINILSNRLFEEVRTKRGLVYQVYTSLDKVSSNDGILCLTTQEPSAAMEVIFLEVGRLRNELVEAKVLQDTIAISINDYYLSKGSVSTQASMLGRYELNGSGWEDYPRIEDKMKAVTPEDIMEVAREYLENINFGFLGDPGKIDRELFLF